MLFRRGLRQCANSNTPYSSTIRRRQSFSLLFVDRKAMAIFMRQTTGDKIFNCINLFLLTIAAFLCLFPFINILAISLSENKDIMSGSVFLWPKGWNLAAYKTVFTDITILRSFGFTCFLTVLFTAVTMVMTTLCAYPLSKKQLKGRTVVLMMITFTMYFSGGAIPAYLLINDLHLLNTVWALVLPGAINTFNMIVMKSFFNSIPEGLEESAVIDGAGHLRILVRIVLPLSMPIIATLALFYAVARWNMFSDALYYINDPKMYPLQLKLRQLITLNQVDQMVNDLADERQNVIPETIKAASIIFATVPILLVYPWLQKYFVKGMMIGSIKG